MTESKAIDILKKYTRHNHVRLTSRGNIAIFIALYCARKVNGLNPVITTDSGGWITYLKYPRMLQMKVSLIETDYSLVKLEELREKTKDATAFLYAQPGGYFVDQPYKEIYKICKKNKCLVIKDVSGSIGTKYCDGRYADFMVCSFGRGKPINLGYGGFVSAKEGEFFQRSKEIFNTDKFDTGSTPLLLSKLDNLKKRYNLFEEYNKKIKSDLNNFEILHKDKWGINVLVKFNNDEQKEKIINYCKTNNLPYKICRRVRDPKKNLLSFIKVNEDAISIDVQYI